MKRAVKETSNERLAYSAKEAAHVIGVNYVTVLRLAKRADFPAVWIGRRVLIPKKALEEWLLRQAQDKQSCNAARN